MLLKMGRDGGREGQEGEEEVATVEEEVVEQV